LVEIPKDAVVNLYFSDDRVVLMPTISSYFDLPRNIPPFLLDSINSLSLEGKLVEAFAHCKSVVENKNVLNVDKEIFKACAINSYKELNSRFDVIQIQKNQNDAVIALIGEYSHLPSDYKYRIEMPFDLANLAIQARQFMIDSLGKSDQSCKSAEKGKASPLYSNEISEISGYTVFLDAEDLAEGGFIEAYETMVPVLSQILAHPAAVFSDLQSPSGQVFIPVNGENRRIIFELFEFADSDDPWTFAQIEFFALINALIEHSPYSFYCLDGGNDLKGVFLEKTSMAMSAAIAKPVENYDHPYFYTQLKSLNGNF
jgi:hypothetical protein